MAANSSSQVAIIGAGFAGLGLGYHLRGSGIESFTIFEKAGDVGGTWRENTYPGSGCDIPSHLYSFSFETRYPWGWRYAKQPEILDYLRHCSAKFDIHRRIRFNSEVTGAEFDEERGLWVMQLADGSVHEARFLVSGVGQLSRPAMPKIPGLDRFQGAAFHSAQWRHDVDLSAKRVAVIGTGASAVQFVPEIAPRVKKLLLFQRTPGWTVSKVEKAFPAWMQWLLHHVHVIHQLDRYRIFLFTEWMSKAFQGNRLLELLVTEFCKWRLRRQVRDPQLRAKLTPDYRVGCKRILLSNDWLPAITRENVELVTDAIEEITPGGLRRADGHEDEVDVIIYSTGFSGTDFLAPLKIRGLDGADLRQSWKGRPQAYLGMSVCGFPNFFMMYGPNTNVGSGSIVFMLECQQKYIVKMIADQQRAGWCYADVQARAVAEFASEIRARSQATAFEDDCQSWYKTADGLNTNNWVGDQREFARRTAVPVMDAYRIVHLPQPVQIQKAA